MAHMIHTNALSNFLHKNLNHDTWCVFSAHPDSKIANRFVVTLKAKKSNMLYDEKSKQNIVIKKNGYIRGLIEPKTSCLHVILYIPNDDSDKTFKILNTQSLKDISIEYKTNIIIINSYIPDKQKCITLQKIENSTKQNKKFLNDMLPYDPNIGHKYKDMINSPGFKKRWNL
jgi:hypothetical protein